jgi:outer membrane receptor protein involved in Fe transport
MSRFIGLAATAALASFSIALSAKAADDPATPVDTITVTAQHLSEARLGIQTQTGASTYTMTSKVIKAQPGGENNLLNQVVLQAPGVAQDSFGQLHVRGEHNGLQYRLNGIIIPEGISAFGQTLDPRLASSVKLVTGALPAEYGLRTAGIIDLQTKSGLFSPGGQVGVYGGSHSQIQPSFDYGGSSGRYNYFVSGDYLTNTLGIESPDGSSNPHHDRTQQYHGFAYLEDVLNDNSSLTAILGTSHDQFEIPNVAGAVPSFVVNGQSSFDSTKLDENQREITHFGILSYLHSGDRLDYHISAFARYSSLAFSPDLVGDLMFDGIAQRALKRDTALGIQAEGAYHLGAAHTLRAGLVVQGDRATSDTTSQVLPANCTGTGTEADPFVCAPLPSSNPAYDVPLTIIDNGGKTQKTYSVYVQDEWKLLPSLTLNYGLRYDLYQADISENQLSPRVNLVWTPMDGLTVHAGYARYFSPPPFELVGSKTVAKFLDTSASPAITLNTNAKAERADYYDVGIQQSFESGLMLGLDGYYKTSRNLLDEGQFGAPIILTPFNYRQGRQYGIELTSDYVRGAFTAYVNASYERAEGKGISSAEFNFDPADLAYIDAHYIPLDHQQIITLSAGASYRFMGTRFSANLIYGSGLRKDGATPNGDHVPPYAQVNVGASHEFSLGGLHGLTARFDVINLFDETYLIRDGSGIGVGAPQYGPRRGFFVGLSKAI